MDSAASEDFDMSKCALFVVCVIVMCSPCVCRAEDNGKIPANVRAEFEFLVGNWEVEGTLLGEAFAGVATIDWAPGKQCVISSVDNPLVTATGITGWDPIANEIVQTWYRTDGVRIESRIQHYSPAGWEGVSTLQEPSGVLKKGKSVIEKAPDGKSFRFANSLDDKVTMTGTYRRAETTERATLADLHEFGELLVGRWAGDILLVYDWPGLGKRKGETVASYETFAWIADKRAIEWQHHGGNVTGKTMITWDAAAQQIRAFNVGSAGTTWQTVIWKETPEKWGWRFTGGGMPDGRSFAGSGHWIFADGRNKLTLAGDMSVGDEKLEHFDDVYRRVDTDR
jgi:hypothetical protein